MNVSICSVIKDEQDYIDEWINYNFSIGFNDIYLFEDYGSKPHDEICDKYDGVHLMKVAGIKPSVPLKRRQTYLLNYFIKNYNKKTDWVGFIDVDEFIILDECNDIHDLLDEFKDEYGLYLYWLVFNANGRIKKPPKTISTFDAYPNPSFGLKRDKPWYYKSFVNLKKCVNDDNLMRSNHEIKNGVNTKHLKTNMVQCYHKAHINHYFTKSWEDWIHKIITRGVLNIGNRKIDDFFECNPDMIHLKEKLYHDYNIKI